MFSSLLLVFLGVLALSHPGVGQGQGQGRNRGPRLITRPMELEAAIGDTITLPCDIRNVGRRSVFWFKGDAQDNRELIMQMKSVRGRFLVPRPFQPAIREGKLDTQEASLVIRDLEASDSNVYTCSIAVAGQTVSHTLRVTGGRAAEQRIDITRLPADGNVVAGEGEDAAFSCLAIGSPEPTITWFRESDASMLTIGPVLTLPGVTKGDAGAFTCRAENGVATPATATFHLTVEFVDVELGQGEVVVSGDDLSAVLTCTIYGNPEPAMTWYDATGPITGDDRRYVTSQGNTHYLQLNDMTPDDLGEYQCYGYSDKARDYGVVRVTGGPGTIHIIDATPSPSGLTKVHWQVQSLAPITFYHLTYTLVGSDVVDNMRVTASSEPVDGYLLYTGSADVHLTQGGYYELRVKAVAVGNVPGPDMTKPFVVDVPEAPPSVRGRSGAGATPTTDEDMWKWWKLTLTAMSRLPQLARVMQP